MTIIECFERDPIDNVATCLSLRPNKLVFIGEEEALDESVERYRAFLERRRLPITVETLPVKHDDVAEVIRLFSEIIETGDECIIDMAGGDPIVAAAAGAVHERYKDTHPVTLQRIDPMTGIAEDSDGDGEAEQISSPKVTVKELIELYGGSIVYPNPPREGLEDINPIWNASIRNATQWNRRVGALLEIEKYSVDTGNPLQVAINFGIVRGNVANYFDTRALFDALIDDLEDCGVITIADRTEGNFRYRYKSSFARRCLRKQGNVLEYKTLLEARALRKDGRAVFSDCLMSVSIDWDGIIHEVVYGGIKDTRNEIDVLLMHGLTPVFISCKNGDVEEDELYKLNTVAARFGGEHARKVLIATNCCPDSLDSRMALQQRAADMGIYFEADAANLTDAGWQDLLLSALGE